MAFAVASVVASGPIEIADVANVATSFPDFPRLARAAGLDIEQIS
jgi:3-phosphoshikimate 1-carboxyvinyltransferase